MHFRARRRRLRNKAKTLLEDESQENEENYARRYLHTNEGNNITPVHKCGSEYTQMWELRHAHNMASADSGLDTTPCHHARPLSGSGDQSPACLINKNTQSFSTFKPREPIYVRSRAPVNINMLFRNSGLDTIPRAVNGSAGIYEARHPAVDRTNSEQEQVRLLNGSPSKGPDLICSNHGKRRSGEARVTFAGIDDEGCERHGDSGEGICEHCTMHQSLDKSMQDDVEEIPTDPTV